MRGSSRHINVRIAFPGSIVVQTVAIKTKPGPQEKDEGGISYAKIDIDLPDVKNERLARSERITQTSGKSIYFVNVSNSCSRDIVLFFYFIFTVLTLILLYL